MVGITPTSDSIKKAMHTLVGIPPTSDAGITTLRRTMGITPSLEQQAADMTNYGLWELPLHLRRVRPHDS
jgi:hypothetical protein